MQYEELYQMYINSEDSIMRLDNVEIANEILKDNDNEESDIPIQERFIWFGGFEGCSNE